jgi:hypothetical protein
MLERQPVNVRDLLPQPPDGFVIVTTGEEDSPEPEKWEKFCIEILNYLGVTLLARQSGKSVQLEYFAGDYSSHEVGMLTTRHGLPIASELVVSDAYSHLVTGFAHYLSPENERMIRKELSNPSNENIVYLED